MKTKHKWITTFSGIRFDLECPTKEMVCIEDIAHALSHICRFTGHTRHFVSVAQHCCDVHDLLARSHATEKREGLLHDASEAYASDVSKPLKEILPDYQRIEHRIEEAVALRFDLNRKPMWVKWADTVLLVKEAKRHLVFPNIDDWGIDHHSFDIPDFDCSSPMTPEKARREFMDRYFDLFS